MTDEAHTLRQVLAEEERAAVANALAGRIAAIEHLPDGLLRARLCAVAFLTAGYQTLAFLEGPAACARQLRRLADLVEAQGAQGH